MAALPPTKLTAASSHPPTKPTAHPSTHHACRVSSMRAKLGQSGGGAKTEQKLDSTIRILSHKEAKLKVTSQNFDQQEALLARDLAALIADGQYLKHYGAPLGLGGEGLGVCASTGGDLAALVANRQYLKHCGGSGQGVIVPGTSARTLVAIMLQRGRGS